MFKKLIQSKALRSRTAWLITAVLVLPFLLFFHFSGGPEGASGGAAGKLFGKRVPWEQYEEQRRWVRLQWALQFGEIPASLEPMVDGYTWDRLLLVEAAKRERLGINDRELAGVLQHMPSFQDQGRFVPERYYQFLSSLGMSPTSFERLIRQDLMVERLTTRVGDRAQVTAAEVEQAYRDAEERRSLALLTWGVHEFEPSGDTLADAEIEAHYRAHEDLVTRPGASTFDTVGLTREQAAEGLTVEEAQVQRYYDAHPEEFAVDGAAKPLEEVRQQIQDRLLQDAAKRRLTALAVDLEAARGDGQAFEAVAAAVSLPIARHGPHEAGNLFLVDGPDPSVLQAAFALTKEGQISDLVENDRGVHLVRLTEAHPERIPPLEEVREIIVHDLLHPRGEALARAAAEAARAALAERMAAGASFEDAAQALKLSPASLALISRAQQVDRVANGAAVTAAAFAAPAQQLTPVVDAGDGFAVAYVREILPADPAGLTNAKHEELRAQVTERRRQAELTRWMEELRAKAKPEKFTEPAAGSRG